MLEVLRKELKYSVRYNQMMELSAQLGKALRPDEHNTEGGYRVRSLYFDTLHDSDFEAKSAGIDERQKIRIRIYGAESSPVKLELKEKSGAIQRKRSIIISEDEARQMINRSYSFLLLHSEDVAHQLYTKLMCGVYIPKCTVEYNRTAFTCEDNDTRVTFDARLRATEADFDIFNNDMALYPVCKAGEITMEVKYNNFLLTYIKSILAHANAMQISNSKYCLSRTISKRGRI